MNMDERGNSVSPDEPGIAPGRRVYTVTELTRDLKLVIEESFSGLWIEGEISKFFVHTSGHAYITLKDSKSVIEAVMWKGGRSYLRFDPKVGDQVVCRGRLSVFGPRSQYQLIIEAMEPKGLGALAAAFEKLKKKLAAEGLFDKQRKKPLPYISWNVGIVTSPTGAVIRDMVRTLRRRFPGLGVVLRPAKVQGEGAADQVAQGIADLNEYGKVDVIIVGRGGGSIEDLWAFNEEVVARAIAKSAIPVISAVGHETDFTIADFVADLRASTPTAAAEQVAPERAAVEEYISDMVRRMIIDMRDMNETLALRVDDMTGRAKRAIEGRSLVLSRQLASFRRHLAVLSPRRQLVLQSKALGDLADGMAKAVVALKSAKRAETRNLCGRLKTVRPERWIQVRRDLLDRKLEEMAARLRHGVSGLRGRTDVALGKLEAFNPQKVLERGYGIVSSEDGKVVYKSVSQLKPGMRVNIRLQDGEKSATMDGIGARQGKLF